MKLGDRMKSYEAVSNLTLLPRTPVILRLDGNSFSKFTKMYGFEKPFDQDLCDAMTEATAAVLKYCSGSQLGYTQSDEISILLRNDITIHTQPFLANRINKLCSLTASIATVACREKLKELGYNPQTYDSPIFDCRAFVLPPNEVNNYFVWRQLDAFKNCISSYAWWGLCEKYGRKTAMKMLKGQNTNQRQEILFRELSINANDIPTKWKRGIVVLREKTEVPISQVLEPTKYKELCQANKIDPHGVVIREHWISDNEIPRFDKNKDYINSFLL
jgi:tRNA(His) guanylyltransferase